MKHWNFKDIAEWHKKTFPKHTLLSQKLKFLEEYREYLENGDLLELCDMYIVNCTLRERFDFDDFDRLVCIEINKLEIYTADFFKFVDYKMNKNLKRKWIYKDGVYRHEEKK